jgi:ribonucleoside-diphosphate reductase alpha chain
MTTTNYFPTEYQSFIHKSRYARWLPDKNRRETWSETVSRYFDFFEEHLLENNNFKLTKDLRKELEEAVLNLEVMPSMRCLMTAGEALKRENMAGFNCSAIAIDSPRAFDEVLYVLMNGVGVGFSVEQRFVDQLPVVAEDFNDTDTTIHVADSKMGWAKALKELIHLLYGGQIPRWDVSKVRAAGVPLKTFGGRASGPDPLVSLFKFCVSIFRKAAGRKLTTLECHDIVCKIAEIVVVGGVRRCCFYKYKVQTTEGWKQISEIVVGDKIVFENDEIDVLRIFDNGIQQTMNIHMDDNTTHICTPEHRWYVYNHDTQEVEWKETRELLNGNYSMLKPKINS